MFVDLFLSFHLQFILPFLLTLSPFAQSISFSFIRSIHHPVVDRINFCHHPPVHLDSLLIT